MIKINLLPQKRTRRVDKGQQALLAGFLLFLITGSAVYFLVHSPLGDEIGQLEAEVVFMNQDNQEKQKQLVNFKQLKDAVQAAQARKQVIQRLNDARATPAHMLHELSRILTMRGTPTMTKTMAKELRENPNREFSTEWDAKHVWITSFTEKAGQFRLEGGAQSDSDMTQLALRLQASVYFHDVIPEGGTETVDKDSGIKYYKFVIVGKVAY